MEQFPEDVLQNLGGTNGPVPAFVAKCRTHNSGLVILVFPAEPLLLPRLGGCLVEVFQSSLQPRQKVDILNKTPDVLRVIAQVVDCSVTASWRIIEPSSK